MEASLSKTLEACAATYTTGSIEQVQRLILNSSGSDWKIHAQTTEKPFLKHTVFRNYAFEAVLIQWKSGFATDFHAHPSNGCILKVLDGSLKETVKSGCEMTDTVYTPSTTSYMHDSKGVHKVTAVTDATSLHIYAPPGFYDSCTPAPQTKN